MNPDDPNWPAFLMLMVYAKALGAAFEMVMGMTVEEWDELSYQRIMSADASGA